MKKQQAPAEVLLHRDLSTNQQVGMLLSVCNTMLGALINPERDHENIPGKRALAGEAHSAAEITFIGACDRLDKIIGDSARWGIDYQLRLEQQYNERHQEQMKMLQAQQAAEMARKKSSEMVTAPHWRYKPALIPLEEGGWAAFLGDVEDLESGILGLGANPEAALANFDLAFAGKLSPAVQLWLKGREADLEKGIDKPKPFPKENEKEVDTDRDRPSQIAESTGPVVEGDSPDPESQCNGS